MIVTRLKSVLCSELERTFELEIHVRGVHGRVVGGIMADQVREPQR